MTSSPKAKPKGLRKAPSAPQTPPAPPEDSSIRVRREAKERFGRILREWRAAGRLDVPGLRAIVEEYVLVVPADASVPPPDLRVTGEYGLAHHLNMLGLCLQVGKAMGIGGEELRQLGLAALVHDFGKEIPENHPEKAELEKLDQHGATGYRLLTELAPDFPRAAAEAVRDHHERIDGRGPLHSVKFSEMAAIVALVDTYDARVTHHWFRGATSPQTAFNLVNGIAHLFPAAVVDAFRASIVPYPKGSPVFISGGRRGEVVEANATVPIAPVVRIDGSVEDLAEGRDRVIDLIRDPLPL